MSKLIGKVAVVTGASKGIGAAIAKALAADGASVVVNYASDKSGAEKTVKEITSKGGKAISIQGSVDKAADIENIFAEAKKAYGRVTTLVNNAGVFAFQPIEQVTEEEYHRQHNTNVLGTILAAREAVKHFGDAGGSIVNISSIVAELAPPASVVYSSTKGAVDTITRVLANELGPKNIRVNAVAPGLVETEGTHAAGFIGSDFAKEYESQAPLRRVGRPDDIASVVAFLASDDAKWLTGQIIKASGGAR